MSGMLIGQTLKGLEDTKLPRKGVSFALIIVFVIIYMYGFLLT